MQQNPDSLERKNKKTNDGKRRNKAIFHEGRPTSPKEFGKCNIHGKSYTWNNNESWKIISTPDLGLTLGDAAAAVAIATAASVITTAKQRTTGAALTAASIAAKAIKFPTTIGENNDNGTAVTKITQDQLNEFTRIQANLGNQMPDFLGKLG